MSELEVSTDLQRAQELEAAQPSHTGAPEGGVQVVEVCNTTTSAGEGATCAPAACAPVEAEAAAAQADALSVTAVQVMAAAQVEDAAQVVGTHDGALQDSAEAAPEVVVDDAVSEPLHTAPSEVVPAPEAASAVSNEPAQPPAAPEGIAVEGASEQPDGAPPRLSVQEQVAVLEALLLAHGEPLGLSRVQELLHCSRGEVLAAVQRLQELCRAPERGFEVVVVAERLQLRTKAAYGDFVRTLLAVKPRKLSQAALETLAVIAYRQPVVKSEVDKIRGVDGAPTIKTLVERGLIKILGYQASVGQPALYGTTDEFLKTFGLAALSELPTLRDLKALAREPGEAGLNGSDDDGSGDKGDDAAGAPEGEGVRSAEEN